MQGILTYSYQKAFDEIQHQFILKFFTCKTLKKKFYKVQSFNVKNK